MMELSTVKNNSYFTTGPPAQLPATKEQAAVTVFTLAEEEFLFP